jgi:ribosomal protein S21
MLYCPTMATNVEIKKTGNENNITILRKFSKRVQSAGILQRVRSKRYSNRNMSEAVKKKRTLKSILRREEVHELIKMGKLVPDAKKGRRR